MTSCGLLHGAFEDDRVFEMSDYEGPVARWCSGCGDHSVLTASQRLLAEKQLQPESTVFVSGIGCSSRFPHYMKTYGFHGIHGRALTVATGVKLTRPELDVFVVMGDGEEVQRVEGRRAVRNCSFATVDDILACFGDAVGRVLWREQAPNPWVSETKDNLTVVFTTAGKPARSEVPASARARRPALACT